MRRPLTPLLVVCLFVCPLLFFTNLTRNPYVTQICLLNIAALLAGAWLLREAGAGRLGPEGVRTPLDLPLAAWMAACALSFAVAFLGHAPFYRSAMFYEGLRHFLFLIANMALPFYLSVYCWRRGASAEPAAPGAWAAFALVWGALWIPFAQLRTAGGGPGDIWSHAWDGYGAALWAGGFAAALWLCRRGRWEDFLHLSFAAGFLASVYAVLQYFQLELIWPKVLNPYGGRSVSTFGNPNFMSSFNVVLLPLAAAFYLRARGGARLIYAAVLLSLLAALLCSLTRSSWIGAAAALAVLLLGAEARAKLREEPRAHGLLLAAAMALVLAWPQNGAEGTGYASSVVNRLSEGFQSIGLQTGYGSWTQRVLIWSCGWLMGAENPLTGKGWGLFELFYPFYQGHLLAEFDFFHRMRTHANNAHNELVEVFSQTGLIGVGAFLWIWAAFARAAWERLRGGAGPSSLVPAAAAAGVAGMLVDNGLNVSMHFAVPAFMFWWAAGLAVAPDRPAADAPAASRPVRAALTGAAVLLAGLGWIWIKVWNREVHYFAGFKLLRAGQAAAAIAQLERSRAWGPPEVNALYELGNAYARANRYEDADRAYHEALRANAGYDEIYYNIGVLRNARLGKPDSALDYFRAAAWINPLSPEVVNSLVSAYFQQPARHAEAARAFLERALRVFPDNPAHWNNLGYLHSLADRIEEAEQAWARALSLDPGLATAEQNLRALAARRGRPRHPALQGLEDMRAAQDRLNRRDLGPEALRLSESALAAFPDSAVAAFLHGTALLARGRADEALPLLVRAVAREPRHSAAWTNLGEAYRVLGRPDDAAAAYRRALAADPQNAAARQRLGL